MSNGYRDGHTDVVFLQIIQEFLFCGVKRQLSNENSLEWISRNYSEAFIQSLHWDRCGCSYCYPAILNKEIKKYVSISLSSGRCSSLNFCSKVYQTDIGRSQSKYLPFQFPHDFSCISCQDHCFFWILCYCSLFSCAPHV